MRPPSGAGENMVNSIRIIANYDPEEAILLRAELSSRVASIMQHVMDSIDFTAELLVLEALTLILDLDDSDHRRTYVNPAHVPFLDTRFRIFDSYLCSLNPSSFYTYVRLYPNEFEALHDKLARKLSHIVSHRAPIPSRQRLCIYLRFTGHGSSFSNLSGEFAIGISTACTIAHEVARAIIDELHDCAFPTPNASTWAMALEGFRTRWDYPAAMGALDGKHIACVCPKRSGSLFYNYKNYYSIVLLALVDANYKCVLYDLGAAGRSSDAGVFMTSEMKTFLEDNDGDFPVPVDLDGMGTVPCHFLVDQGFRLTTRFLRPYSNAEAAYDSKKRYFNYKMNSARRVVENYFGILAGRFRLLLRRVHGTPEHIKDIVQSLMILHNLLVDAIGGDTVVGRYSINPVQDDNARFDDVDRTTDDAKLLRDTMKDYFCIRDCIRLKKARSLKSDSFYFQVVAIGEANETEMTRKSAAFGFFLRKQTSKGALDGVHVGNNVLN
ncbi:hypothetical protein Q1695_011967 [Nippostrongylus brasiliensis]|nr:hypothetical protein Q1695_011967 [Nippostrongylus brasiliensis]